MNIWIWMIIAVLLLIGTMRLLLVPDGAIRPLSLTAASDMSDLLNRHGTYRHLKGQSCLVVGGSGFLGQLMVLELLHAGATVRVFDIAAGRQCHPRLTYIIGDLTSEDDCRRAISTDISVVFHCASPPYNTKVATLDAYNVDGTRTLARVAAEAQVAAFVLTSSASVVYDGRRTMVLMSRLRDPLAFRTPTQKARLTASTSC